MVIADIWKFDLRIRQPNEVEQNGLELRVNLWEYGPLKGKKNRALARPMQNFI